MIRLISSCVFHFYHAFVVCLYILFSLLLLLFLWTLKYVHSFIHSFISSVDVVLSELSAL